MKRLARLIARLYPAAWRHRYGQELEALIEDSKPSLPWLLDILIGALTMQIKSNGLRIALFGIAGAIVAASTLAINDYYVCSAVLNVRDANAVSTAIQQALSRRSLWRIIEKNGLYESDRNRIPNEDITEKFRHSILIKSLQNQQAITVSYHGPDRVIAKAVTEDLAQLFLNDNSNIIGLPEISLPQRRAGHKRAGILFTGLCAGMAAGVCYVPIMNRRRAT
jgi:hypothetical protein